MLLSDLGAEVLKEILLQRRVDSPFVRSRRYFEVMGITLEIEDLAASLIAEQAEKHTRTGARALRTIFGRIVNPLEYDPTAYGGSPGARRPPPPGVTAAQVRQTLGL